MENKLSSSEKTWNVASAEDELVRERHLDFSLFTDRLRYLYRQLVAPSSPLRGQCERYLEAGCRMFSADYGVLAQVRKGKAVYWVYDAGIGGWLPDDAPNEGIDAIYEISQAVKTTTFPGATQTAVNLSNMAYNGEAIKRYLGTQVAVSGSSFGVLCFLSVSAADAQAFVPQDIETIELMADGVAKMIELQTAQPKDASVALGGFATPGVKSLEEYIEQARLPDVYGIPGRVVEVLQRRIGHSSLAIDHIAEELNLSKRTLQRRLQQQHINFAQLRDQVRFHYSIDYLIEQTASIDSISASLDFSDRTSFTNAFKRWTSLSPSTFRKLFRDYT